jgi:hypothetical protein
MLPNFNDPMTLVGIAVLAAVAYWAFGPKTKPAVVRSAPIHQAQPMQAFTPAQVANPGRALLDSIEEISKNQAGELIIKKLGDHDARILMRKMGSALADEEPQVPSPKS